MLDVQYGSRESDACRNKCCGMFYPHCPTTTTSSSPQSAKVHARQRCESRLDVSCRQFGSLLSHIGFRFYATDALRWKPPWPQVLPCDSKRFCVATNIVNWLIALTTEPPNSISRFPFDPLVKGGTDDIACQPKFDLIVLIIESYMYFIGLQRILRIGRELNRIVS